MDKGFAADAADCGDIVPLPFPQSESMYRRCILLCALALIAHFLHEIARLVQLLHICAAEGHYTLPLARISFVPVESPGSIYDYLQIMDCEEETNNCSTKDKHLIRNATHVHP